MKKIVGDSQHATALIAMIYMLRYWPIKKFLTVILDGLRPRYEIVSSLPLFSTRHLYAHFDISEFALNGFVIV